MKTELLQQIRYDLDLVFPRGGYTLTSLDGDPELRLTWDEGVHDNLKRFSEEIVSLHNVKFETAPASCRRSGSRSN